jgi:lipoprotein-releasing system permease protein
MKVNWFLMKSNYLSISVITAWRYFATQNSHSISGFISRISILGLIVSVSLLVVVMSVMNGFEKEMRERILGLMPHITLYDYAHSADWQSVENYLDEHPRITGYAPYYALQGMIIKGKHSKPIMLIGVDPKKELQISAIHNFVDTQQFNKLKNNEIIISNDLALKLNLKKGKKIIFLSPSGDGNGSILSEKLVVKEFFNSGTEVDQRVAFVHMDWATNIAPNVMKGLRVQIDDLFSVQDIANSIINTFPNQLGVSNWTQTHGNLYSAILLSKKMLIVLMLIVLSVAIFNVVTSLVLLVKDKSSDLAILKTLGASPNNILLIFLILGVLITSVGTFMGLVIGLGMTFMLDYIVQCLEYIFNIRIINTDVYPLNYLPTYIQWEDLLIISFSCIIIGLVSTLFPAWQAYKLNPAETINKSNY